MVKPRGRRKRGTRQKREIGRDMVKPRGQRTRDTRQKREIWRDMVKPRGQRKRDTRERREIGRDMVKPRGQRKRDTRQKREVSKRLPKTTSETHQVSPGTLVFVSKRLPKTTSETHKDMRATRRRPQGGVGGGGRGFWLHLGVPGESGNCPKIEKVPLRERPQNQGCFLNVLGGDPGGPQEGSRYSLSSIFTFSASLKKPRFWTPFWRLFGRPTRHYATFGASHFRSRFRVPS